MYNLYYSNPNLFCLSYFSVIDCFRLYQPYSDRRFKVQSIFGHDDISYIYFIILYAKGLF